MKVGIPREIKNHEYRVAITPAGVHELAGGGHQVVIEAGGGAGSSIPDEDFVAAGAPEDLGLDLVERALACAGGACRSYRFRTRAWTRAAST